MDDVLTEPGTDYADVVAATEDQDTVAAVLQQFTSVIPASHEEANAHLRAKRQGHVFVGVGLCLNVQRTAWNVPALWPTANAAAEHSDPIHHYKSLDNIPGGSIVYMVNNHFGHVVTVSEGGNGICQTTDFGQLGYICLASLSKVATWCGATDVFVGETINGYDVVPSPVKPQPPFKAWELSQRATYLHEAAKRAKANDHATLAKQLETWADRVDQRIAELRKHHK